MYTGIIKGGATPTAAGAAYTRGAHGGRAQFKPRPPHGVKCHTLTTLDWIPTARHGDIKRAAKATGGNYYHIGRQ